MYRDIGGDVTRTYQPPWDTRGRGRQCLSVTSSLISRAAYASESFLETLTSCSKRQSAGRGRNSPLCACKRRRRRGENEGNKQNRKRAALVCEHTGRFRKQWPAVVQRGKPDRSVSNSRRPAVCALFFFFRACLESFFLFVHSGEWVVLLALLIATDSNARARKRLTYFRRL